MIGLDIHRIHNTPMRVITKDEQVYGCFWYNNFYRVDAFTEQMWETLNSNKEVLYATAKDVQ